MKRQMIYCLINIAGLAVALLCFGFFFMGEVIVSLGKSIGTWLILIATAFVVYSLKCIRLYITLTGTGLTMQIHTRQFLKTAAVNILIPLKLGELFRIYCYGFQINNYARSIVAILLDRFSDTLALLTVIIFATTMYGSPFSLLFYLMVGFMVFLMAAYMMFPRFYEYWNTYLLEEKANRARLNALKTMHYFCCVYKDLRMVVEGRMVLLYVLSLLSWLCEIGGVLMVAGGAAGNMLVTRYLESALGLSDSIYQHWFVFISLIVLAFLYAVFTILSFFRRSEG